MTSLKITKVGSSLGVVLSKELLAQMRVGKGDTVYVSETPHGIQLSAHSPQYIRQLRIAENVMEKNHVLLKRLAEND